MKTVESGMRVAWNAGSNGYIGIVGSPTGTSRVWNCRIEGNSYTIEVHESQMRRLVPKKKKIEGKSWWINVWLESNEHVGVYSSEEGAFRGRIGKIIRTVRVVEVEELK